MTDSGSDTFRQLIRLANDHSLDPQSRSKICEMAGQVRDLHNVLQKFRDLDARLKEAGRSGD